MKRVYCFAPVMIVLLFILHPTIIAQQFNQGKYFGKTRYEPEPLPEYNKVKTLLPSPIYNADKSFIDVYWKAWELAFNNFQKPTIQNGYVSNYIDASFNSNTFQWDDCFMSMFCNYGYPFVPGISSLDNFYAKQHEDGEICREIVTETGKDFWANDKQTSLYSKWGYNNVSQACDITYVGKNVPKQNPILTLDGLHHPIFAWAEWESYLLTGNKERLMMVWDPLEKYYFALKKYLQQGNGLFMTDWASMDNSPRNKLIEGGGTAIDISSEMALFAKNMIEIGEVLKKRNLKFFRNELKELTAKINSLMWDNDEKFYTDLTLEGNQTKIKTIAGFFPLVAGIPQRNRAELIISQLENPKTFGRLNPIPSLAADEKLYDPRGGYWRGGVWDPTNTMVIEGLRNYGYEDLAYRIALKHLRLVTDLYKETGTIWECYSPDFKDHGWLKEGVAVQKDFVGWSGLAPILYFIKYIIGIEANSNRNEITWKLHTDDWVGCEKFRFNGHTVDLKASPVGATGEKKRKITVQSDGEFNLIIFKTNRSKKHFSVKKGKQEFLF